MLIGFCAYLLKCLFKEEKLQKMWFDKGKWLLYNSQTDENQKLGLPKK